LRKKRKFLEFGESIWTFEMERKKLEKNTVTIIDAFQSLSGKECEQSLQKVKNKLKSLRKKFVKRKKKEASS